MTVLADILVWLFIGFPVILAADMLCTIYEYRILKPRSNDTMVAQLKKLSKDMAKIQGWKTEAKKLEKLAIEMKKETTDAPATT